MTPAIPSVLWAPASAPPHRPPDGAGAWPVLRGWPRSRRHALLELDSPTGSRGAQWFAEADDLHQALAQIPGAQEHDGVLIHPQHTDERLPSMATRIGAGERVVVHRPGRRAVLRGPGARAPFTKVTRRRRAAGSVQRHQSVAAVIGTSARLAQVLAAGRDWFTLSALPGRSLLDLGADEQVPADVLARAWAHLGTAMARMHQARPQDHPGIEAEHDARDEYRTAMGWLDPVQHWGLLPPDGGRVAGLLRPLTAQAPGRVGLLHRDLHDQQVLYDRTGPEGQLGLLDLDTAAWGETALDVANVLAHLRLRVRQDLLSTHRAQIAEQAFLTGLDPTQATWARVAAYRTAAQLRLCAVYVLRPTWRGVAQQWFTEICSSDKAAATRD